MQALLVGLDLGTSAVKVGLFTPGGGRVAVEREPYPLYTPHPGWAEQEPQAWWAACVRALRGIAAAAAAVGGEIAAIGLAGQCPGHVLLGPDGVALGRAIIWRDQRAIAEAAWLAEHVSPADAERWTGMASLADATLPPARLLWLKAHRCADWQRAQAILQPKDFIAFQLTGAIVTDVHSAYSLARSSPPHYDPEYLAALDIAPGLLPTVQPPRALAGHITPAASRATQLPAGTPVVIGTIDAFCDLLGSGAVQPGLAVDVAGTSEMIALATAGPARGEAVFPATLNGDINFLCGPTQAGGEALRWLARGFFPDVCGPRDFGALEAAAAAVPPGGSGLIFLPYLEGERAPIWDPHARGAFVGLTLAHDRSHCALAVYEGIAFAVRHVLEQCERGAGQVAQQVHVCGGGAVSAFWNQLKADVLNRLVVAASPEAACVGAAALAGAGLGLYPNLIAAAQALADPRQTYRPDPDRAAQYEPTYRLYCQLYPSLKPAFAQLAGLRRSPGDPHAPA